MAKINWFKLIAAIIICQLIGFIGSIFTTQSVNSWYLTINKPAFTPPGWVIGGVWTMLFILMGVALYLVWNKKTKNNKKALIIFGCQLILNILWSVFFFFLHSPLAALVEIFILWFFILLTIIYFAKISKSAAYLLIPYILWVSFASFLNYSVYIINK